MGQEKVLTYMFLMPSGAISQIEKKNLLKRMKVISALICVALFALIGLWIFVATIVAYDNQGQIRLLEERIEKLESK